MKKITTILGAFFFASILLLSCDSKGKAKKEDNEILDAKKAAECMCDARALGIEMRKDPNNPDLVTKSEKLEKKCQKLGDDLDEKYGSPFDQKDDDKSKKFWEAFEEAIQNCI